MWTLEVDVDVVTRRVRAGSAPEVTRTAHIHIPAVLR